MGDIINQSVQDPFSLNDDLPVEIWLVIMQSVLQSPTGLTFRQYYRTLTGLRLVSKLWDSRVLQFPEFWACISSEMPREMWDTVLERSKSVPFHGVVTENVGVEVETAFFKFLELNQSRIFRMEIEGFEIWGFRRKPRQEAIVASSLGIPHQLPLTDSVLS